MNLSEWLVFEADVIETSLGTESAAQMAADIREAADCLHQLRPAKIQPTGYVATCRCGAIIGATDAERTERRELGQLLGGWLAAGCTVSPRFEPSWEVRLASCKCAMSEAKRVPKPAFPRPGYYTGDDGPAEYGTPIQDGLSDRALIATHLMAAMVAAAGETLHSMPAIAVMAASGADALLAELER